MTTCKISKKSGTGHRNATTLHSTAVADQLMRDKCAAGGQGGKEATPLQGLQRKGGKNRDNQENRKKTDTKQRHIILLIMNLITEHLF